MNEQLSINIAHNVQQLRATRGMTQQQMAKLAGLPRPTWANLESGGANPTVSVLVKVATALQVRIEELLDPPRAAAKHHPSGTLPIRRRGDVEIRKLLPETVAGLDLERLELPGGAMMKGAPHKAGTREYLACERGEVELRASGETYVLRAGDVVVFRGDQKHSYRNPGRPVAIAYSVIAFAGVG